MSVISCEDNFSWLMTGFEIQLGRALYMKVAMSRVKILHLSSCVANLFKHPVAGIDMILTL